MTRLLNQLRRRVKVYGNLDAVPRLKFYTGNYIDAGKRVRYIAIHLEAGHVDEIIGIELDFGDLP